MAILGRGRVGRDDAVAWLASLVLLAGGALRAGPGALRPGWWQVVLAAVDGSWGGRFGPLLLAGAIGGALAAPDPLDRLAGLLPCPPAACGGGQGSEFLAQVAGRVVFGG
jgi:hypothetical protein